MTSFVFCVLDMSVRVDAILVCHVIDNVVAADNVGTLFVFIIALKMLLRQLGTLLVRNGVRLTTSLMRHRAAV